MQVLIFDNKPSDTDTIIFSYNPKTKGIRLMMRNCDENVLHLANNNIKAHSDDEILIELMSYEIKRLCRFVGLKGE